MIASKWIYLYAGLLGFALAISMLVISAAISQNDLTGVVFGMIIMVVALYVPLAVFTGAVAKRLDVLAETGEDQPPLR